MVNNNLLVSIIVPVFNVENYIRDSIESICNQTYENIEIIMVNDGSQDSSIDIAEKVLKKSKRNYRIISQKNKGLPAARNLGIINSEGDYLCFIDSDDCIDQNHIYNMIKTIRKYNSKICFSHYEEVNEKNKMGKNRGYKGECIYSQSELFDFFMKRKPAIHCCSLLIERNILFDNNIFFNEKLKYGEDVEFMWRLFSEIDFISCVKQYSYKYLIRKNSIMKTTNIEKGIILMHELENTLNKLKQKYPNKKDAYKMIYYRTVMGWIHTLPCNTNKDIFNKAIDNVNIKNLFFTLVRFPDLKIKILSLILFVKPTLFYKCIRLIEGRNNA